MRILEEFWYGNIEPTEYDTSSCKEYKKMLELIYRNSKGIKYMLSFDGIRGEDDFTVELPKELYKRHEFIPSGNSSFKKVMDKESIQVLESLYLNW